MKLSIVIVNYRGWRRLRQCLESLESIENGPFSFEVIIVDNQSNDNTLESFKSDFKDFTFIENTGNNGFANGCNLGASQSAGDYILFLNPDTIVNRLAIEQLIDAAEHHPEIYVLSCHQLNEQQKQTKPYGYFPTISTLTGFLRAINKLVHGPFPTKILKNNLLALFPHWVSGSVILISKKKFFEIGQWNEDYWMYYEDVDLCKRVRDKGKEVALLLDVTIEHNHGGASRINIETKALTKTETIISKHVYINHQITGATAWIMHSYMVLENLIMCLGAVFLSLMTLYSVDKVVLYQKVYVRTIKYYLSALRNRTWLSPRSKKYRPA